MLFSCIFFVVSLLFMLFLCIFLVVLLYIPCCFYVVSLLFSCWQNVVFLLVFLQNRISTEMARYAFVVQTHLVRETLRSLLKPSLEYAPAISFAAGTALERWRQMVDIACAVFTCVILRMSMCCTTSSLIGFLSQLLIHFHERCHAVGL